MQRTAVWGKTFDDGPWFGGCRRKKFWNHDVYRHFIGAIIAISEPESACPMGDNPLPHLCLKEVAASSPLCDMLVVTIAMAKNWQWSWFVTHLARNTLKTASVALSCQYPWAWSPRGWPMAEPRQSECVQAIDARWCLLGKGVAWQEPLMANLVFQVRQRLYIPAYTSQPRHQAAPRSLPVLNCRQSGTSFHSLHTRYDFWHVNLSLLVISFCILRF